MKLRLLLGLLVTGMLSVSCESEYDKQLDKAKQLVDQTIELRAAAPESGFHSKTIAELQETILFHAHLSGNSEVFLQELKTYQEQAIQVEPAGDILITKYP